MKTIILGAVALAAGAWLVMRRRRQSERSEEGEGAADETATGQTPRPIALSSLGEEERLPGHTSETKEA